MTNFIAIIGGIIIISTLYIIPIATFSYPLGGEYSVTISSVASMCQNTFIALLGGSDCEFYKGVFLIGWIIGGVLVIYGLMTK
jgi:hypothetical protein